MNPSDAAYWDGLYATGEDGWELNGPSPPLARWAQHHSAELRGRRTIAVGAGRGNDARMLAEAGALVTAVDFAEEAVRATRQRCAGLAVEVAQLDIFRLPAELERLGGAFDLWVEHTCFCAIEVARRAEYVAVARAALRPGGRLLGIFYAHHRDGGPPFATNDDELRRLFHGWGVEEWSTPPDSLPRRAGDERLLVLTP